VPVIIDDSPLPTKREPRSFRSVQATALPNGEVTEDFGRHLYALQQKRLASMAAS
jgi:hypothetical protein